MRTALKTVIDLLNSLPGVTQVDTSTSGFVGLLIGIAFALLAYLVQSPPGGAPSEGEPSDPPEVSRPAL